MTGRSSLPTKRATTKLPLPRRLVFITLLVLAPIVLPELAARLFLAPPPPNAFPDVLPGMVRDDTLLWRNLPGYGSADQQDRTEHGPFNSLGFRGPEMALEKPPGVVRILSLGESTTAGDLVLWDETYSHLLEAELSRRGHQVQVMNGGVGAWSSVQSTLFFEREGVRLDPDLVLFYHEVNDFFPTTVRSLDFPGVGLTDLEAIAAASGRAWFLRLVRSSRLLTSVSVAVERTRADKVMRWASENKNTDAMRMFLLPYNRVRKLAENGAKPWMSNPNELVRVPDRDREATLRKLIALTREREMRLVLYHPAYRVSVPHSCLLVQIALEEHVPWLDVEDLIAAAAAESGSMKTNFFLDPYHPNQRGHALIARGTADLLERRHLLASPR